MTRSTAQQETERTLAPTETLGLHLLAARVHYLRAALRLGGESGAGQEYASARRLLDEIKAEDGNQRVLDRADLGAIYAECVRRANSSR